MLLTLTSCGSTKAARDAAAKDQGVTAARVTLPPLPDDLTRQEPHAPIVVGGDPVEGWKAERRALARANTRISRFAPFYNSLRQALR